jgi:hypothetical protein
MQSGDRVDVVLDVFMVGDEYKVIMVGVFAPHEGAPAPAPGVWMGRNRVHTFLDRPLNVRAFGLEAPAAANPDQEAQ